MQNEKMAGLRQEKPGQDNAPDQFHNANAGRAESEPDTAAQYLLLEGTSISIHELIEILELHHAVVYTDCVDDTTAGIGALWHVNDTNIGMMPVRDLVWGCNGRTGYFFL